MSHKKDFEKAWTAFEAGAQEAYNIAMQMVKELEEAMDEKCTAAVDHERLRVSLDDSRNIGALRFKIDALNVELSARPTHDELKEKNERISNLQTQLNSLENRNKSLVENFDNAMGKADRANALLKDAEASAIAAQRAHKHVLDLSNRERVEDKQKYQAKCKELEVAEQVNREKSDREDSYTNLLRRRIKELERFANTARELERDATRDRPLVRFDSDHFRETFNRLCELNAAYKKVRELRLARGESSPAYPVMGHE